jgi:hypothetical protein
MTHSKKSYLKPELTIHGNVEVLTKATGGSARIDAAFPAGTPASQLTFS